MMRILLGLVLVLSCSNAFAEEVDGEDIVRAGFRALSQSLVSNATQPASLGGVGALVGFGLWTKLYRDWKSAADGTIRSELGDARDFLADGADQLERGLTLAQLVRRAYPKVTGELTTERIVRLAVQPFGNQLSDMHGQIEAWARTAKWVNLGDTCVPELNTPPEETTRD